MIEEYKLNYEVALARKAKLHCHPAEAVRYAYNTPNNYEELKEAAFLIENKNDLDHGVIWDTGRSKNATARKGRGEMVHWLLQQGFNVSAISRILGISIPSVAWSVKHVKPTEISHCYMRIFDNE